MGQRHRESQSFTVRTTAGEAFRPHPDFALAAFAQKIYKARRERDQRSPVLGLFQDPAWDILLDLFISYTQNTSISIMSAGLAANVPASTALRWIWTLEEAHLVVRKLDASDKRRSFVSLAPDGISYMREILAKISEQFRDARCC